MKLGKIHISRTSRGRKSRKKYKEKNGWKELRKTKSPWYHESQESREFQKGKDHQQFDIQQGGSVV